MQYHSSKKFFYKTDMYACKNTTDIYNFIYFKLLFKKFFYFESVSTFFKNVKRYDAFFKQLEFDFIDINTFLIFNLSLRNQYPILNFKLREKSILDFSKIIVIGFILNLNYYYEHEINIKSFFFKNYNTFVFKTVLFYSENNFLSNALMTTKIDCKNLNCFNNLNLLNFEFYKSLKDTRNSFLHYFSNGFFFNDFTISNYKSLNKNKIFFSSSNIKSYDYDFLIALKQVFERSCMFLNIFGVINDFTFSSYRYFFKELKNDWFIFKAFFKKCGVYFKFKLSNFKNYIFNHK